MLRKIVRGLGSFLRTTIAVLAAIALVGYFVAKADYTATQGTGTTFGSAVVATIHYAKMVVCDLTAPATQCQTVNASGQASVTDPGIGGVADAVGTPGSTGSLSAKSRLLTSVIGTAGAPATNMLTVQNVGGEYPTGAVVSQDSDTGTTAATSSVLPGVAATTQYVCGFSVRANATAAATGNSTISDGTWTLNFTQWTAPNASGVGVTEMIFQPCKPASAQNTAITLTSAAAGAGGVTSTAIWGYRVP
jgi:hypothetical protein